MQLNIRPMRNGGVLESSATDTEAPSTSAAVLAVGLKAVDTRLVRLQKSVDGLASVVGTSAGKLDNFSVLAQSMTTARGVTAVALALQA
ncbi:hypothetical protein I4F81_005105 [Pyropia yezoensis]|uniref:Uncharacterized protein n=1 Tax=Pyropia yezoensis TaxID=2788 RepID=A0ACC3BXB4_PYRYE|nr:hypothetical protein I4F81_005105 [Neopyropia yezoensis]